MRKMLSLALLLIPITVSCKTEKVREHIQGVIHNEIRDSIDPSFNCLDSRGTGHSILFDKLRVGYKNIHDDMGFWCEDSDYHWVYRSHVYFDVSSLKGVILEASIKMNRESTERWTGNFASNAGSCAQWLYIRTAAGPTELYAELPTYTAVLEKAKFVEAGGGLVIDVTPVVQSWVKGQKENHGLTFVGTNEQMQEGNDRCVSIYNSMVLSVELLKSTN